MSGDNTRWVHRWFDEVWNQSDTSAVASAIDDMMAPDAVMHGLGEAGRDTIGSAPFKEFNARFRSAFSRIHIHIDATVEQGDMIAARWTARLTHDGPGFGVAPTDTEVTVTGMSMARLRNGRMMEGWNNWDTLGLMAQIRAVTPGVTLVEAT